MYQSSEVSYCYIASLNAFVVKKYKNVLKVTVKINYNKIENKFYQLNGDHCHQITHNHAKLSILIKIIIKFKVLKT